MVNSSDRNESPEHYGVLDGWRAISIVMVLAGHLLPLGSKRLALNGAVATTGMAIFFTLSGFLITTFLLRRSNAWAFLTRRFCRIVPLAWLYSFIVLAVVGVDWKVWSAHLFFYGNLPPFWLIDPTAHLWSLALEVQFYLVAAIIVGVLGRQGLWLLPCFGISITAARIFTETEGSIVTWLRADEILAGCSLALLKHYYPKASQRRVPILVLVIIALTLLASAHQQSGPLNYARPYLSALVVGITLYYQASALVCILNHRILAYIARISYALYVMHGGLGDTWLGSGDTFAKFAKRPLYFAVLFLLAHLSTYYYEERWIKLGKRWSVHSRPTSS